MESTSYECINHCDSCEKTEVRGTMFELRETPVLFLCIECHPITTTQS